MTPDVALISTVDYITPPVDDPWWFGQIAAANSLSDIYAMGGKPLTALNLVMFPSKKLDLGLLKEILRGGNEKILEARASMAGGHSVDDNEPKYGLAWFNEKLFDLSVYASPRTLSPVTNHKRTELPTDEATEPSVSCKIHQIDHCSFI